MTRKDYIRIAAELRATRATYIGTPLITAEEQQIALAVLTCVESRLAATLKIDNPRFDSGHFLAVVRGEKDLESRPPRS